MLNESSFQIIGKDENRKNISDQFISSLFHTSSILELISWYRLQAIVVVLVALFFYKGFAFSCGFPFGLFEV
jgi:hypothetical protein